MTFLWPHMLWTLLLLPLLVGLYLWMLRRKKKYAVRFASLGIVKEAMGNGPGIRRHIPPALILLSVGLMLLATARPMATLTLPSQRDTVILTMDISGSMRAADVDPDRLTASQEAARTFIAEQPKTTRVGVVAFAGTVNVVQQPTLDRNEVLSAIDRFHLQRGTNIGDAILVSLQTIFPDLEFEQNPWDFQWNSQGKPPGATRPGEESPVPPVEPGSYTNAAIILLTDGQPTTGPDPVNAARMAADRGVRVFTVGFGSLEGDRISFGGMTMRVQLDEESLRQIAEVTRGRYFHAASSSELSDVYRELSTQFIMETEQTEITALFTALSAVILLSALFLSLYWFYRIV